jgi:CheY-like chemotaxis protein
MLDKLGVTVSVIHDGQQAVDAIVSVHPDASTDLFVQPDLILMDLNMPVLDGYSATERIRQWELDNQRPRRPIIALTADAFEEDRQHCLAVGMDDFLSKPIALGPLKLALAKWLPAAPERQTLVVAPEALEPVVREAFAALITEIMPLLADNKFAAISRYCALQALVARTHLAEEINALNVPLQEMRFDFVLERLRQIAFTHVPPASDGTP